MAEVDLTIKHPDRLQLVKAKSSETASNSLFTGVNRVRGYLATNSKQCESLVVYGGSEAQRRGDAKLVPWAEMDQYSWIG